MLFIYLAFALLVALIVAKNVYLYTNNKRFNQELAERNPEMYNRLLAASLEK